MPEISDKEKLCLLGLEADPPHSLRWYRDRYPSLPSIIQDFIVNTIDSTGTFPGGINKFEPRIRYQKYYLTIEKQYNQYVVRENNTDRGEIWREKYFSTTRDAAKYFICRSGTAGGCIRDYWKSSSFIKNIIRVLLFIKKWIFQKLKIIKS